MKIRYGLLILIISQFSIYPLHAADDQSQLKSAKNIESFLFKNKICKKIVGAPQKSEIAALNAFYLQYKRGDARNCIIKDGTLKNHPEIMLSILSNNKRGLVKTVNSVYGPNWEINFNVELIKNGKVDRSILLEGKNAMSKTAILLNGQISKNHTPLSMCDSYSFLAAQSGDKQRILQNLTAVELLQICDEQFPEYKDFSKLRWKS